MATVLPCTAYAFVYTRNVLDPYERALDCNFDSIHPNAVKPQILAPNVGHTLCRPQRTPPVHNMAVAFA